MTVSGQIWELIEWLLNWPTKIGFILRAAVYSKVLKKAPLSFSRRRIIKWYRNVRITAPGKLEVGPGTSIERGNFFMSEGGVTLGRDVLIAPYCQLITHQHTFREIDRPIYDQDMEYGPIAVEDWAWIGTGTIVLPGVRIGKGAIVGAGSSSESGNRGTRKRLTFTPSSTVLRSAAAGATTVVAVRDWIRQRVKSATKLPAAASPAWASG